MTTLRVVAALVLLTFTQSPASAPAAPQGAPVQTTPVPRATGGPGVEERGHVVLTDQGKPTPKRFVLRYPKAPVDWTGRLVIGAHGGTGGGRVDADGRPMGTDETALDDVIGGYALEKGYAYASFDRDGTGATRAGLALTYQFTRQMRDRINALFGQSPERTYLVGLSAGGGIARFAAEDDVRLFDAVLIIAGAAGDAPTRLERQALLSRHWPAVDPRLASPLPDSDPRVKEYADALGTPVGARVFWPFNAPSPSTPARGGTPAAENTTGQPKVLTIEVAGTYDNLMNAEILAYRRKFEAAAATAPELARLHRLYFVEGVWHISGDDDAVKSFQFAAKRMNAGDAIVAAMAASPSYLPTVRESLDHIDRWMTRKVPPPPNRTIRPGPARTK